MMYFSTAYSILHFRKYKKKFPMIICGLCMLVAYFPTGSARNVIAGLYLGCFLLMFPSLRHNRVFSVMFMISFMIVEKYIIDINNLSITMDNDVFMETATSDVDLEKRLLIPTVTILYPHIKEALKIKIQILSCNISSLILRERLLLPPQNLEPANKENVHNNKQILKVNICESLNA